MSVESSALNVERSGSAGRAVFLSYASQDAAAAQRICEALRASGIDVWFDQSELRGGDSWDAKIRRQIKDCALFVPIVSAHTQERLEGYFRLEWHLAERRMQHMHEEAAFLLPVVIDAHIDEANARVPAKFLEVQWVRLPEGSALEPFALRVRSLLAGETGRASVGSSNPAEKSAAASTRSAPANTRRRVFPVWATVAIAVAGLGIGAIFAVKAGDRKKLSSTAQPALPVPPPVTTAAAVPRPLSEAEQLVARVRALQKKIGFTRDELALAEDLARRATELDPTLASAWAVRAYGQVIYTMRGWERPVKRARDVQAFAGRALALEPEQPEALLAQGLLLSYQDGDTAQVEAILRRVIAAAPLDAGPRRNLGVILGMRGQYDRSLVLLEDAVRLDPRDPLAHYNLATHWSARGDPARALDHLEQALAVAPTFASALLLKAALAVRTAGDLATMRASLDRLTAADRMDDRAVFYSIWAGLLERRLERVIEAAAFGTNDYLADNAYTGPKSFLVAQAYRVAGRDNQARLLWQEAESLLRQRVQEYPIGNRFDRARLAVVLAWLGQRDAAAREIAEMEKFANEAPSVASAMILAWYYAALGDAGKAEPHLSLLLTRGQFGGLGGFSVYQLRLDPIWDKLRGQPAFEALAAGTPAAAPAPTK